MSSFSSLSQQLTKTIDKAVKKEQGIFFTPPNTVKKMIELLPETPKQILEPSCGSCEFITELSQRFTKAQITGIEFNSTIYESIQKQDFPNTTLINEDFLKYNTSTKYDLIIGNPPYFVMKKSEIDKEYYPYFEGRPNIFTLFIVKSLKMLSPGGILSFVLPKSFMNCLYYNKTREYIATKFKILNILICDDDYLETKQETVIVMLQNIDGENLRFSHQINQSIIFGTDETIQELIHLYSGATFLNKLGFDVNVGNVVWNQCKDILTDDASKTRLIYSSDIKNNELVYQTYTNHEKKNYIHKTGMIRPILVLNRGYGVGTYKFEYCLIQTDKEYLIENHLICINQKVERDDLLEMYQKIIVSFQNPLTSRFIELYFGNNAVNTTELCTLFPIYI